MEIRIELYFLEPYHVFFIKQVNEDLVPKKLWTACERRSCGWLVEFGHFLCFIYL